MDIDSLGYGDFPRPPRTHKTKRRNKTASAATQHPRPVDHGTSCLFIVLRGLDYKAMNARALALALHALQTGSKSVAILSPDDFLREPDGTYVFNGAKLHRAHRKNFERAAQHFILGTDVVILVSPNIKRAHFFHYQQAASWSYYDCEEELVDAKYPTDYTQEELQRLSDESPSKVSVQHLRRWGLEYEE